MYWTITILSTSTMDTMDMDNNTAVRRAEYVLGSAEQIATPTLRVFGTNRRHAMYTDEARPGRLVACFRLPLPVFAFSQDAARTDND